MEGSVQEKLEHSMPVAWQHSKNLSDCMIELYDKRLWTDVKFRCKDHDESERIHAHKIVLAARSPVFQAMFFGLCADKKDEVELDNAEAKIFDLFLRYIYSDTATLTDENASAVLEMAHFYQVTNLVQFCADFLATILTSENACEILTLALFYKVTTLRDACCRLIDRNAEEILQSEGFLQLSEECLTYILKGDTFYADEDDIFIKAEEWSKRKIVECHLEETGQNMRKTLGTSFYYLRLPTMTFETLMQCTRKKGYFSVDEYEDVAEFINKIPDSSVKSNSCVARLPTDEILTINTEDGKTIVSDHISTRVQISVSRDVKLTNFVVTDIRKHLKYNKQYYTYENCPSISIDEPKTDTFFSKYNEKLLRLTCLPSNRFYGLIEKKAQELKTAHGEDLSRYLDIVMSGTFKLTCQKATAFGNGGIHENEEKKEDDGDEEEENIDLYLFYSKDKDALIFEKDFQLPSSDVTHRRIDLREPLILTKDASPYTVGITMNYGCTSGVKMKTICSNTKTVRSEFGQLKVQDIAGQFAGIESIGFENISNR